MMQKLIITFVLFTFSMAFAQKFPTHLVSVNGFRNPSIGAEYQHLHVSVHAGYYITAFKKGETTEFIRTGLTYWFLPMGKKEVRSSFYAGASYLRGRNKDYTDKDAFAIEAGYRSCRMERIKPSSRRYRFVCKRTGCKSKSDARD
ncbi:hypothetical protein [Flavobacterium sp. 3HN19-14]|uniref:hypothetical protein n=1 Tax=Flavobacterium sp. 3HN19-14 TaxID=3448133 RepID=UPI003EDF71BB